MWRLLEGVEDADLEVPQVQEAPKEPAYKKKTEGHRPQILHMSHMQSLAHSESPNKINVTIVQAAYLKNSIVCWGFHVNY